jgi:cytochrome P450
MDSALFLQSEVDNPYEIYSRMLDRNPVYRDRENDVWAVYSYEACQYLFNSSMAEIPGHTGTGNGLMNDYATTIVSNLARLSNAPAHPVIRRAVVGMFGRMQPVCVADLIDQLLGAHAAGSLDWVDAVCKKLPALAVLKGFGFTQQDTEFILPHIERLTKIMLPNKTLQQILDANEVAQDIYPLVERHLDRTGTLEASVDATETFGKERMRAVHVSNLIGLLIQSYDAGRGILGNALLLQFAHRPADAFADAAYFQKSVTETLRFDPPIHNTRRVLAADTFIGGEQIEKGETVLLVLAAANRDPVKFIRPEVYDIRRDNNDEHLTFGAGMHMCVAKHLSVGIAGDALMAVFRKFRRVELLEKNIAYEPLVNARLPKQIMISLN